jgi:hypothetical protein
MRASPAAATLSCLLIGDGSLLVEQVRRDLEASLTADLTITDIYRFPTVTGLAAHVTDRCADNAELGQVATQRNALAARSGRRAS